jgi:hypothetical protein
LSAGLVRSSSSPEHQRRAVYEMADLPPDLHDAGFAALNA